MHLVVWAYTASVALLVIWCAIHHVPITSCWAPLLMAGIVQHNYWKD